MISAAHRQEALSLAYIGAVAAKCGMTISGRSHDYGIDVTLNQVTMANGRLTETGCRLDIQAKSTTRWTITASRVEYDLDIRAYDALRTRRLMVPRILVLLALPEDESEWLSWSQRELQLRQCAYWCSFRGGEKISNLSSVRVKIPATQPFSPDELRMIMKLVCANKRLPLTKFH